MIKIKLLRIGKRNSPSFRIVVGPKHRVTEVLGVFNPQENPPLFELDEERVEYWKDHGAQISDPVSKLISGEYEFKPYTRKEGEETELEETEDSKKQEQDRENQAEEKEKEKNENQEEGK